MERTIRKGTGLVHIYCGNGKGKTTTGMGLCLRAAGYGYKVLICQFMKDNSSSERKVLEKIPGITIMRGREQEKFSFQMTPEEKVSSRAFYEDELRKAFKTAREENIDVLFLDEVVYAVSAHMVSEDLLIQELENKPDKLEVIMTGQGPDQRLIDEADYVSEIVKVKHPFDRNQPARAGIER